MITLGGPNARSVRRYGDIVLAMQYINNEPAMVLWPARRQEGSVPCVIGLSCLYKYAEDQYLAYMASKFAEMMRVDQNKSTIFKICRIINDNIDTLCMMKPEPMKDHVDGTAQVRVNGELFETEVITQVPRYGESDVD